MQNVEEAVENGATVVITGLPIDLQVVARLVDRLSSFGHVLVATRRKGRALVTFGAQEGAVRALVDASLRQAGMTLRAINLADAKSNGVEHDMALEHQEKLAARHSLANVSSRRIWMFYAERQCRVSNFLTARARVLTTDRNLRQSWLEVPPRSAGSMGNTYGIIATWRSLSSINTRKKDARSVCRRSGRNQPTREGAPVAASTPNVGTI